MSLEPELLIAIVALCVVTIVLIAVTEVLFRWQAHARRERRGAFPEGDGSSVATAVNNRGSVERDSKAASQPISAA